MSNCYQKIRNIGFFNRVAIWMADTCIIATTDHLAALAALVAESFVVLFYEIRFIPLRI